MCWILYLSLKMKGLIIYDYCQSLFSQSYTSCNIVFKRISIRYPPPRQINGYKGKNNYSFLEISTEYCPAIYRDNITCFALWTEVKTVINEYNLWKYQGTLFHVSRSSWSRMSVGRHSTQPVVDEWLAVYHSLWLPACDAVSAPYKSSDAPRICPAALCGRTSDTELELLSELPRLLLSGLCGSWPCCLSAWLSWNWTSCAAEGIFEYSRFWLFCFEKEMLQIFYLTWALLLLINRKIKFEHFYKWKVWIRHGAKVRSSRHWPA